MTGSYAGDAAVFLIQTLFGLYILVLLLRVLLQILGADYYNPLVQFLVKATAPPLQPLNRFIPRWRGIQLSAVALMLVLQVLELWLVLAIQIGYGPQVPGTSFLGPSAIPGLLVMGIAELLRLLLYTFTVAIIVQVILSWVGQGHPHNPVVPIVWRISEPVLAPARRVMPEIGGLDLSPLAVLILLQLAVIVVVQPIRDLGRALLG